MESTDYKSGKLSDEHNEMKEILEWNLEGNFV